MRRIEIITPQNVPILYQLASVRERMLAFFLDALILLVSLYFIYLILIFTFSSYSDINTIIQYLVIFPVFVFYSLVWEVFNNGQTIGKRAMKLRVIKLTGMEMSLSDYMLRWAFRWIDIWGSLGAIAALQISSSEKGQRIGDLLADTTVIRIRADFTVSLKELLAIKSTAEHEVIYPEIRRMKEEEMLLVKLVLDQYRKFPNEAHQQVLFQTAQNIAQRIDLEEIPKDRQAFLNSALTDYVTVTRS
jgi:uncharacterized RDD family membrane protein YckC